MKLNYDTENDYISIRDRDDYKALRREVLAYLEKVNQRRSRREIYAKMSKLKIVREALLHSYLADILDQAVSDRILVQTGSAELPKWKFRTEKDEEVVIIPPPVKQNNNRLFGSGKLQINPYAESVYKI